VQAWQLPALQQGKSAVRDRFGICRVPGGEGYFGTVGEMMPARVGPNRVPYLGSSALLAAVRSKAPQRDAAFALLADLSGRETSGQIVLDVQADSRCAGGAIRMDQLEDRSRWDAFGLDQARTAALKETLRQTLVHRGLKNPALCLRIPGWKKREQILGAALREALKPGGDAQKALTQAANQWGDLDKGHEEKTIAEYRISLGLLPK
jgi:hypothetical protein